MIANVGGTSQNWKKKKRKKKHPNYNNAQKSFPSIIVVENYHPYHWASSSC
jgi:hypothetical protein